jgi:hypothetical protein
MVHFRQVKKLNDCIGEEVEKAVKDAKNGEVRPQEQLAGAGLADGPAHITSSIRSCCSLLADVVA